MKKQKTTPKFRLRYFFGRLLIKKTINVLSKINVRQADMLYGRSELEVTNMLIKK